MNIQNSEKEKYSKMYIIGAGNFAREIYSYLAESNFIYNGAQLVGFLADKNNDKNSLDNFNFSHKIVGDLKCLTLNSNDFLIVAITDPTLKEHIFDFYSNNNGTIISYIHPSAIIGHDVSVGIGTVFAPYSIATTNVTLGRCCTINAFSSVGHDAVLGDFCTLSGHCDITGNVKLGDKVFMGSHASIIPGVQVGAGSIIGAGSLVIRKVKENTTVFGNPAKKIM
jgi:sugar O-acyltransferase (sialic acid O-acetyltransferase NeuD family)